MANILFKKGSYSNFKTNVLDANKVQEGALYLIDDIGELYLGLADNSSSVKRVQGSVLYFDTLQAFTDSVKPPYSTDLLYFIANSNALVRYDGTKWIQLNVTLDTFNTAVDGLSTRIDNINTTISGPNGINEKISAINSDITGHDSRLDALESLAGIGGGEGTESLPEQIAALGERIEVVEGWEDDITQLKQDVVAAQNTADQGVTNAATAQAAADKAQGEVAALEERVKTIEEAPYATESDVNDAKSALIGTVGVGAETDITIRKAISLAQAAQSTADNITTNLTNNYVTNSALNTKLNEYTTTEALNTKLNDYATTSDLNSTKSELLGTANTAGDTIHGALKAANAAQDTADAAQEDATQALTNAEAANNNANSRVLISDFNTFKESNTSAINAAAAKGQQGINDAAAASTAATNAQNAADAAQATANAALPKAGGVMGANNIGINMNGGKITNLAAPDPNSDSDAATVKYVKDSIRANDAMTFKGVLGDEEGQIGSLPSTADVGDTYKVGVQGVYDSTAAKVGDLFINAAESNSDTPVWVHISSGYEDDYDQVFAMGDNQLKLMDGTKTNVKGTFTFANNVVMTVKNNSDVTAALVWDTF